MGDFDRLWAKLEAWKGIPLPIPTKAHVNLVAGKLAGWGADGESVARQTLAGLSADPEGRPALTDLAGDLSAKEWATLLVAANHPRPTIDVLTQLSLNFRGRSASPAPRRPPSTQHAPAPATGDTTEDEMPAPTVPTQRAPVPAQTETAAPTQAPAQEGTTTPAQTPFIRHAPAPAQAATGATTTAATHGQPLPTTVADLPLHSAVSLFELLQEQRAEMQRQREEHAHQSERLWDHIAALQREKEASQRPPSPDRGDSHARLAENDRLRLSLEMAKSSVVFASHTEHDVKFGNLPLGLRTRLPQYRVLKTQEPTAQLCYAAIAKVKECQEKWHAATVDGLRAKLDNKWPKFVCLQLALALELLEDTSGTLLPELLFVAECLVASTMPELNAMISARVLPETSVLASSNAPLMPAPKAEPKPAPAAGGSKSFCIDFARGACRRGVDCRFSHEQAKN
jgi:hypothetical protein